MSCVRVAWVRTGPRVRCDEKEHASRGKECKVTDYWNTMWSLCQCANKPFILKAYCGPLTMPWQKVGHHLRNVGEAQSRKFFPCKSQCSWHPSLVPVFCLSSSLSVEGSSCGLLGTTRPWGCAHVRVFLFWSWSRRRETISLLGIWKGRNEEA